MEEIGEAGAPPGSSAGTSGSAGLGGTGGSGGTAGFGGSAGSGGKAGSDGASGSSGSGGSAGKAGSGGAGGTAGAAGSGGSAGKAGAAGTSGAAGGGGASGAGGSGGKAGAGGSSGSAGNASALFIPAATTCSSGNVDGAFAVCRNCHSSPVKNGAPVSFVSYADVSGVDIKVKIATKVANDQMPPAGTGFTLTAANKTLILNWIAAGAVGVPNPACP